MPEDDDMDMKAKKIVATILDDMLGRGGLDEVWGGIDEDIQEEIRATWIAIVHKELPQDKSAE